MKNLKTFSLAIAMVISLQGFGQKSSKIEQLNLKTISGIVSKENTILKSDFVVGALGIVKKKEAQTYSSQIVKSRELTQAANPNIAQSLVGKVSGLQINTTNNGVNPTSRIVIRGNRSISGNNEALIVIDNVISTTDILTALAPETVDSIYVIKGVQGAALYGVYGANGVIMVRTKLQFDEENLIENQEPNNNDDSKVVANKSILENNNIIENSLHHSSYSIDNPAFLSNAIVNNN